MIFRRRKYPSKIEPSGPWPAPPPPENALLCGVDLAGDSCSDRTVSLVVLSREPLRIRIVCDASELVTSLEWAAWCVLRHLTVPWYAERGLPVD